MSTKYEFYRASGLWYYLAMEKPGKSRTMKVTDNMISEVMREMGKRGGEKKVAKGFSVLSAKERRQASRAALKARWDRWRAENPEKAKLSESRRRKRSKKP